MHIHILGICGTFMGGVALLARQKGFQVTGQDANVYPPMSDQLRDQGIELTEGFDPKGIPPETSLVIIGNALSRGNPAVEAVLERGLRYSSGAQWLSEHILQDRWVVAIAGTHGKTTTSTMAAWIMEYAGLSPGFLIGGVGQNFGLSARLGQAPFFVVEADEYDTAFFDKRSKFVHYRPRTLVLNNLEFDHADIFPDLAAIQRQFHHLMRTIPGNGKVIRPSAEGALTEVLEMGCWSEVEELGGIDGVSSGWSAQLLSDDGSRFEVRWQGQQQGEVSWSLSGHHNVNNALAALAAARHAGVPAAHGCAALSQFMGVKRRMEVRGRVNGVTLYDDFAHHPTAIATTLEGLRRQVGSGRIIALLEPRSNTMRMGVHRSTLLPSLGEADRAWIYRPKALTWSLEGGQGQRVQICDQIETIIDEVVAEAASGDHIVVMSNGGFGAIHERLLQRLEGVNSD